MAGSRTPEQTHQTLCP
uniref:Uncharacterized protein n=1 Tax=Arundo donax TaxID=35708 RepID=A0A0A9FKN6_ARUDO